MFLIEKIELYDFTNSEQKIVDYFLGQGHNIADISTSQIANETFTSKSSIVRIAQKLGFKGWSDFKKSYLEEMHYLDSQTGQVDANYPFNKGDNFLQIAHKLANLEKEAIDETLSLITAKQINQSIAILKKASCIHVFAASNNLLIICLE